MISYAYRALHKSGQVQKGHMAAANENDLCSLLRELDLELIEAKAQRTKGGVTQSRSLSLSRAGSAELIQLCRQLAELLEAGLPFIEAVDCLIGAMESSPLRDALTKIGQSLRSGDSIANSFATHKDLFSPLFLTLLAAGETTGDLKATFQRLTEQLRWQEKITREINSALRYPLFLLCIACGVTSFMMLLVVPQIVTFLSNMGTELPFMTRLLIGGAELFAVAWWVMPLLLLLGLSVALMARKVSMEITTKMDAMILSLPIVGKILTRFALSRMATSFSLLIKSGLPIAKALSVAAQTVGNRSLEKRLFEASHRLEGGQSLSQALTPFFPVFFLQVIRVGGKTGSITSALDETARSFEREARKSVASFLGSLEPTLTILVGSLLAWVVLAVLGPVYGSLAPLSRGLL